MKRYVVFKEKLCSEDIGVYETFGIKSTSFDEREKFSFSDISVDEAEVTKLCEKCNELDVSPRSYDRDNRRFYIKRDLIFLCFENTKRDRRTKRRFFCIKMQ